jgi:hypothetical protein
LFRVPGSTTTALPLGLALLQVAFSAALLQQLVGAAAGSVRPEAAQRSYRAGKPSRIVSGTPYLHFGVIPLEGYLVAGLALISSRIAFGSRSDL